MVIPEKTDYKNCPKELFASFTAAIEARGICQKVAYKAADEKSHFDRYGFIYNNRKVSVVYDNKAHMLSVTAFDDVMPILNDMFVKLRDGVKPQPKQPKKKAKQPKVEAKQSKTESNQSKQKPKATEPKIKPEQKAKQPTKAPSKPAESVQTDSEGGDITLKKFTVKRFDEVLAKLKKQKKKYKIGDETVTDKGKATELKTYAVSGDGQKLKLRFMPKKQVVQLQGKHGSLFSELQLLLSEETDYRAAVDAHIEQSKEVNKRAAEVERQLKKLVPSAYKFLSEQSKIDFTIGVIELINSTEEHFDYSMLLLPPFRGLERLIIDLQRAQNIVVKMIGQAYEKENGEYVLKASYRRKINSIVYAEVMADLYREYVEKRNFYAHSDSSDRSEVRMINKREQASTIFTDMLKKVDYNCKKLSEIGFSV